MDYFYNKEIDSSRFRSFIEDQVKFDRKDYNSFDSFNKRRKHLTTSTTIINSNKVEWGEKKKDEATS